MKIPELLAPAGDKECAEYAISAGADAVYLGLQAGSARAGAKNFTFEELNETLRYAHERGCRVYLALNILESDGELDETAERAARAANLGVDAIIVQDLTGPKAYRIQEPGNHTRNDSDTCQHADERMHAGRR